MAPRTAKKTDSRLAARLAALASLGASVIHFAVVPAHWQEWIPAGLFFASIALFQLVWARLVLTRTTTPVLALGIILSMYGGGFSTVPAYLADIRLRQRHGAPWRHRGRHPGVHSGRCLRSAARQPRPSRC